MIEKQVRFAATYRQAKNCNKPQFISYTCRSEQLACHQEAPWSLKSMACKRKDHLLANLLATTEERQDRSQSKPVLERSENACALLRTPRKFMRLSLRNKKNRR